MRHFPQPKGRSLNDGWCTSDSISTFHNKEFWREITGHKVSSYYELTSIYDVMIFCHAKISSYKQVKINKIGKLVSKIGCLSRILPDLEQFKFMNCQTIWPDLTQCFFAAITHVDWWSAFSEHILQSSDSCMVPNLCLSMKLNVVAGLDIAEIAHRLCFD